MHDPDFKILLQLTYPNVSIYQSSEVEKQIVAMSHIIIHAPYADMFDEDSKHNETSIVVRNINVATKNWSIHRMH